MAKKIMIQGTMSNVGKSLICAGLCRIFRQDGYRVAPFKSQNMALNSYITEDGLEMGRAQVVQAEAAGIEPQVEMNPILLKPSSDVGAQVIVKGKILRNMRAGEYFAYKKQLLPVIQESLEKLESSHDIIVIEGAGSPAEINLKQEDIVNMGMAKLADAPVLLVGDIDRGGVFAQLFGTISLLEEEEKSRVKGLIINKFRGEKGLLENGVSMLEELCKIPVVGVTPFLDVDVEEEDSLTHRFELKHQAKIDVVVVHLPRISNFTDFMMFESMEGVSLRYVKEVREVGNPDLLILPGTKNTISDLRWLRESGMAEVIKQKKEKGIPLWGICGGYQMLGEEVEDSCEIEGGGREKGLGFLPFETVFSGEKTCKRVQGRLGEIQGIFQGLSGMEIEGYEIHVGKRRQEGEELLCQAEEVFGTYVHGIFDRFDIAEKIIEALAKKKGISWSGQRGKNLKEYKEEQYDKLAKTLREHLDLERIYKWMEEAEANGRN